MKYGVIVADPPWSYEDKLRMGGTAGVKRSADSKYSVMPLSDIIQLPVQSIAAESCVLALWCPNSLLFSHGFSTLALWGFEYKQLFTWVKTAKCGTRPRPGMGRMFRNATESALIGVRGKPKCHDKGRLGVDLNPWLGHSTKPETLQNSLESMFQGPYLELFARRWRVGWSCVGNEAPGTEGVDIREWFTLQEAA